MKIILIISSLLCLSSFGRVNNDEEVPILSAKLVEVREPEVTSPPDFQYVLTMYKLLNNTSQPSSFTLCKTPTNCNACENSEPNWDCQQFFSTKENEKLRCNAIRYAGASAASSALIVDEKREREECDKLLLESDGEKIRWTVRTYTTGKIEKNFLGYPEPVH